MLRAAIVIIAAAGFGSKEQALAPIYDFSLAEVCARRNDRLEKELQVSGRARRRACLDQ